MTSNRPGPSLLLLGLLCLGFSGALSPLCAQESTTSEGKSGWVRVGINMGGTSLAGITVEFLRGSQSLEATLGTLNFRNNVSLSLAAKHYLTSGKLRPVIGIGLWGMGAWTEEGSGSVLLFRVPTGVEWRITESDALGLEVGFNRGLAVNRLDPEDDTPVRSTIIPFPGAYYRRGDQQR